MRKQLCFDLRQLLLASLHAREVPHLLLRRLQRRRKGRQHPEGRERVKLERTH